MTAHQNHTDFISVSSLHVPLGKVNRLAVHALERLRALGESILAGRAWPLEGEPTWSYELFAKLDPPNAGPEWWCEMLALEPTLLQQIHDT